MTQPEFEIVEVAGEEGFRGAAAPLPPRNPARREGVGRQDQVLVPVGVPASTPRERVREVAGVNADDELRRARAGRRPRGYDYKYGPFHTTASLTSDRINGIRP